MNYSRSLGHFLENRGVFLKKVAADIFKQKNSSNEMNLLNNLRSSIQTKVSTSDSNDLTVAMMLNCSMHLGHSKSYWNPNMAKFILACLRQAASVTAEIASKAGKILFVGTGEKLQRITYEAATYCNQFYINQIWMGGTISNSKSIIGSNVKPDLVIILDLKRNLAVCDTDCDPRLITYPIPANDESLPGLELVAKSLALAAKKGSEGKLI